jgi:hypothetical protein
VMAAVTFVIAFDMKVLKHLIVKNLILKFCFETLLTIFKIDTSLF